MLILSKQQTQWLSFIWLQHYCYNLAAYPSTLPACAGIGRAALFRFYRNADIRGITAHKVYPINALLQKPVSSYLTFSPFPLSCHVRFCQAEFAEALQKHVKRAVVIFCGTFFRYG
jgi:hypothetical protein